MDARADERDQEPGTRHALVGAGRRRVGGACAPVGATPPVSPHSGCAPTGHARGRARGAAPAPRHPGPAVAWSGAPPRARWRCPGGRAPARGPDRAGVGGRCAGRRRAPGRADAARRAACDGQRDRPAPRPAVPGHAWRCGWRARPGTGGPGVAAAPPLLPPIGPVPNPLEPERWTTWAKALFGALTVDFFTGILEAIRALVGALFGALGTDQHNLLIPIPAALTYDHPVVRQYQGLLIGAANAGLVCVLALGGINVILKDRIGATYHDAMELLPRFMLGVAFINLARRPGELLIDCTNAAIAGVGATGAPGWGALPTDVRTIGDALLAIFYLVALLCLVLQIYLRLVLVDLLLILTPLALLAWILPQTQEIARRWTNAFVSVVLTFFVQSLALKVGAALLQGGLAETSGPGALAALFLSGAFFVLLFRLPGLVSQQIGSAGTVGRILLARTLLGGATRGGGRAAGATAAGVGGQGGGLGGGRAGTLASPRAGDRP